MSTFFGTSSISPSIQIIYHAALCFLLIPERRSQGAHVLVIYLSTWGIGSVFVGVRCALVWMIILSLAHTWWKQNLNDQTEKSNHWLILCGGGLKAQSFLSFLLSHANAILEEFQPFPLSLSPPPNSLSHTWNHSPILILIPRYLYLLQDDLKCDSTGIRV